MKQGAKGAEEPEEEERGLEGTKVRKGCGALGERSQGRGGGRAGGGYGGAEDGGCGFGGGHA